MPMVDPATMNTDENPTSPVPGSAAERIAALNAVRAAGTRKPSPQRKHPAKGARRVTLIASVAAVAGLSGAFALTAASGSAAASVAASTKSATVATSATKTTTGATTASSAASTSASTTAGTTATTTAAVTTSQGS
jgi:hypothetical protein